MDAKKRVRRGSYVQCFKRMLALVHDIGYDNCLAGLLDFDNDRDGVLSAWLSA